MNRKHIVALLIAASSIAAGAAAAASTAADKAEFRAGRELRRSLCTDCAPGEQETLPASRIDRNTIRLATKLAASAVCADPGATAWFAEEEDHLTAFLNSQGQPAK